MKMVIDVPEETYKNLQKRSTEIQAEGYLLENSVLNGTPLPKGHGRILDEKDILDTENNDGGWYDLVDMPEYIAGVEAIIEADNERRKK